MACTVSYEPYWYLVRAVPQQPLSRGMKYTATIGAGVVNLRGVSMTEPYSWEFTVLPEEEPPPVSGPYIVATDPDDRSVNIPTDTAITVTWSEAMNPASFATENVQLIAPQRSAATIAPIPCRFSGLAVPAFASQNLSCGRGHSLYYEKKN